MSIQLHVGANSYQFVAADTSVNDVAAGLAAAVGTAGGLLSSSVPSGATVVMTAVGSGTPTFSFTSALGGQAAGGSNLIQTQLTVTAQGQVSHSALAIGPAVAGAATPGQVITVTTGGTSIASTIDQSSPNSQFVVGGSKFPVVVFNATSSVGTSYITEMEFQTDANSTITGVSLDSGKTFKTVSAGVADVTGLDIPVTSATQNTPISVVVAYNIPGGAINNGIPGDNITSQLKLVLVKSQSGNTLTTKCSSEAVTALLCTASNLLMTSVAANPMYLVASVPTVSVSTTGGNQTMTANSQAELLDVTVTADTAGSIRVDQIPLNLAFPSGNVFNSSSFIVKVGGVKQPSTSTSTNPSTGAGETVIGINGGYPVAAGASVTFQIFGTPTTINNASVAQTVVASVNDGSTDGLAGDFKWTDVAGGSAEGALSGAVGPNTLIPGYPSAAAGHSMTQ